MAHPATIAASAAPTFSAVRSNGSVVPTERLPESPPDTMGSWFSKPAAVDETSPRDPEQVRVVSTSEYKEAGAALAEAFLHDHVSRYFVDTPETVDWTEDQKWELHKSIMEYATYAHILKGLTITVGEDYGAVALWMPPGQNMDDLLTIFRSGLWRLQYKLPGEGKKRFFGEFLPLLHDLKAAVLGDRDRDSWYLVYVGTRPSARGKGYARKLIEHVTKMADEQGRACYLESSNDINPRIYGKMGFHIRRKCYLQRAESPIVLDLMVREPHAEPCEGQPPRQT